MTEKEVMGDAVSTDDQAVAPYKPVPALTPRPVEAFCLLIRNEGRPLSAKQLGSRLGVNQRNVYRIMQPLMIRGMVVHGKLFKYRYAAPQEEAACAAYRRFAAKEFDLMFGDAYGKRFDRPERRRLWLQGKI